MKVATLTTLLVAAMLLVSGNSLAVGPDGSGNKVQDLFATDSASRWMRGSVTQLFDLLEKLGIHYVKPACEVCMQQKQQGGARGKFQSKIKKGDETSALMKKN
jgi:hypothetical protein